MPMSCMKIIPIVEKQFFIKRKQHTSDYVQYIDNSESPTRVLFLQLKTKDIMSFKTLIRRLCGIAV